jgi:putative transposase
MLKEEGFSERAACRAMGLHRSTAQYSPKPNPTRDQLEKRLRAIALKRPRFGYRRLWAMLRRENFTVSMSTVWRHCPRLNLQVRWKKRRKKVVTGATVPCKATYPKHVWAYDFVHDACESGEPLRILTVIDEFTRECLALEGRSSWKATDVIAILGMVQNWPVLGSIEQSYTLAYRGYLFPQ